MKAHIISILESMNWGWPEQDPKAVDELRHRIEETARREDVITYSDLVRDATFNIPTINDGVPFQIVTGDWSELDRSLVGDFLGYLSYESYVRSGVFISALVVTQDERQPGPGFDQLMHETGMLTRKGDEAAAVCWAQEVQKGIY